MTSGAKNVVWGTQGSLKVIDNVTIRQSAYDFLFDFNRNRASILYRFRDIAGYLSKVADFDSPQLHLAPPYGVTPVEFCGDLWHEKTRVPGVSCGVVCVILRLAVLVELRFVADRRTDRQTQGHGQYRGCMASRGKNQKFCLSQRIGDFSDMYRVNSSLRLTLTVTIIFRGTQRTETGMTELYKHSENQLLGNLKKNRRLISQL